MTPSLEQKMFAIVFRDQFANSVRSTVVAFFE